MRCVVRQGPGDLHPHAVPDPTLRDQDESCDLEEPTWAEVAREVTA